MRTDSYTLRVLTQAMGITTMMLRIRLIHKIHWWSMLNCLGILFIWFSDISKCFKIILNFVHY